MTTFTDEPANALNIAEKVVSVDGDVLASLFSKIKENERINRKIEINVDREPKEFPKTELKDFAEQMVYFRKKLGYTQKQVGEAIGVSEDTYRRYELKEIEIIDLKRIERIVKKLEFTEEPKVSAYVKFLMSKPEKKLEKFLKENGISKNKFSEMSGISRRAMLDWFNGKKSISKESYEKIKNFINLVEENNRQMEEEEME